MEPVPLGGRGPGWTAARLLDHHAGLGAECQKEHGRGIDIVIIDQSEDGIGCHRVNALLRTRQPETGADDLGDFVGFLPGPAAPFAEIDPQRRHMDGETADSYGCITHAYVFLYRVALRRSHFGAGRCLFLDMPLILQLLPRRL